MKNKLLLSMLAGLALAALAAPVAAQNIPQALYYKFNEGTGTSVANSAIPGQGPASAAFTGAPTWVTTTQPLGAAALAFGTGTSALGRIETGNWPSTVLPSTQSFTIEFWMRNSSTSAQYLFGDSAASSWRLYLLPSQGISMRGGGFSTLNSSTTAPLWGGTWEHVAFVYDATANTATWFINGVQDTSLLAQTSNFAAVTNFRVGGYTGTTNSYFGDMDEFRFWTEARSQSEIQAWMNLEAGVSGDAVIMANQSPGGDIITGSQTDITIMDLKPQAFNTAQTIASMTFTKGGNIPLASIGNVKLIEDVNDNGVFDTGDNVLGDGPLNAGGAVTFNTGAGWPIAIPLSNAPRLLLTVSSVGTWSPGGNITFSIAAGTDITWSGGTDHTTYPVASPSRDITPPMITLGIPGDGNAYPFNFSTNGRYQTAYAASELAQIPAGSLITEIRAHGSLVNPAPTFNDLVIRLAHSQTDPNIMSLTWDNYIGSQSVVMGPANYTPTEVGGQGAPALYSFVLSTPWVYNGVDGILVDWQYQGRTGTGWTVTTGAGRNRVYALNNPNATVPASNTTSGNWGITFLFNPNPDGAILSNLTQPPTGLAPPHTDLVVFDMNAFTYMQNRDLTSLTFTQTGTIPALEVGNIRLIRDNNADGVVDAGDTVLGTGVLSSGQVTFSGAPLQALTTAGPVRLLLAVDIASTQIAGTTMQWEISAPTDVVITPGPDLGSYPMSTGTWVQRMSGTYTINQTSPADFTDIGAAFDALELNGVSGPVVLEITDSATYMSTPSYSLGYDHTSVSAMQARIQGVSSTNTITLRPATGQTPVIQGNANGAMLAGTTSSSTAPLTGRGALAIFESYVIIEGMRVTGGPNFGIFIQGNNSTFAGPNGFTPIDNVVRGCMVWDIPDGPGIAYMGQNSGYFTGTFENNFVWNCFTNSVPAVSVLQGITSNAGLITIRNPQSGQGIVRHNTILNTSTFANVGGIGVGSASSAFALHDCNNNIIVCTNAIAPAYYAASATHLPNPANCDLNYWFATTQSNQATVNTFALWQTSLRDANGSDQNPLLEDTTGPNFDLHLSLASPCIDPANQTSTLNVDIDGEARPNGTSTDIGGDEYYSPGPTLRVLPVSSARTFVFNNVTGPGGNGYHAADFDIESNPEIGASLTSIELTAFGTGNDATAYSEIAIYEDANTNGTFEFGTDTLIGTFANFPSDNGARTFNVPLARQDFPINTTRTYLIVVKLNGTAAASHLFDFMVTDIGIGTTTFGKVGVPTALIEGVQIEAPTFSVLGTTGSASQVFNDDQGPGNNGLEVGKFTIASDSVANGVLNSIEIEASGTGNDATAYSEVAIYQESGATADFQFGQDILIANHAAFPTDDGVLSFAVPVAQQNFGANVTRTYYIVIKLAGTAAIDDTFNFQVTDIATTNTFKAGLPSAMILGLEVKRPEFFITDTSSTTQGTVFLGDSDVLMQSFEIDYPAGAGQAINIINVRAAGNGHDVNHIVNVPLVRDVNGNGAFDVGDYIIDTQQYPVDNGSINFDHTAEAPFTPPEVREYLVMYDFNNAAPHGATFGCYVQNVVSQIAGTLMTGVPAPSVLGTAGVQMIANILEVNLDGPATVTTVNSNAQGPTGHGLLLANVTVAAPSSAGWTLNTMTFEASGTGNANTAFSEVALYRDTGNNTWDGAAVDTAAAAFASGFDAGNQVTFNLTSPNLSAGQAHRYFLVGKLSGTPTSGQTFNARLEAMNASSATAGIINGVPTMDSTALIIDVAAITVASGPGKPANILRKAGTAAELPMAQFRLTATNDNVGVNSINLTTAGTGDWATAMAVGTGVQLWLDNGDGSFSATSDTLLASADGASPNVLLAPTTAFTVPSGGSVDVWVVVSILDTAGAGASAAADTFSFSVLNSGDVSVTTGSVVVSNSLPPNSADLRIIDFSVATFDPLTDIETGGLPITITGSGFVAPVTVRIGGVLVSGSPSIDAGGTQITGISVPPGVGTALAIQVTSGGLPAEILTDTFDYTAPPAPPKPKDDSDDDEGSGCASGNGPWLPASFLLLVAASAAIYRRRRA